MAVKRVTLERRINSFFMALKPFVKPFLVVFIIYCIAMLSVWRAGVSFVDDRGRAAEGYAWSSDFNRYSSTALGFLLNVNDVLSDISPWSQIFAIILLSVVSVIITYVFCNKKIKYLPLFLSVLIGLQPFVVECWLYKFDAPCMALSIFASVLPILWWPEDFSKKAAWKFGIISAICMFVVWTSYQASSGIFPVLCVYMSLKDYLKGENFKTIIRKIMVAIIAFVVAILAFKFCLPEVNGWRKTTMLSIDDLLPGIVRNIKTYLLFIIGGLNRVWKILIVLGSLGAMILAIYRYKLKALVLLVALFASFLLSFGAYLLLDMTVVNGRSLLGLGILVVPVMIMLIKDAKSVWEYVMVVPWGVFTYSCMVFVLALGNGVADQEKYADFRMEILLDDLNRIYPTNKDSDKIKLLINGNLGYSAVMSHVANEYPIAEKIVTRQQNGIDGGWWGTYKLRSYHGRYWDFYHEYEKLEECNNMKIVSDNYYHTIKDDGRGLVCIDIR